MRSPGGEGVIIAVYPLGPAEWFAAQERGKPVWSQDNCYVTYPFDGAHAPRGHRSRSSKVRAIETGTGISRSSLFTFTEPAVVALVEVWTTVKPTFWWGSVYRQTSCTSVVVPLPDTTSDGDGGSGGAPPAAAAATADLEAGGGSGGGTPPASIRKAPVADPPAVANDQDREKVEAEHAAQLEARFAELKQDDQTYALSAEDQAAVERWRAKFAAAMSAAAGADLDEDVSEAASTEAVAETDESEPPEPPSPTLEETLSAQLTRSAVKFFQEWGSRQWSSGPKHFWR